MIDNSTSMNEWQPIETAPKDGSFILVFVPESRLSTIQVACYCETFWKNCYRVVISEPSHWIPIPESPAKRHNCKTEKTHCFEIDDGTFCVNIKDPGLSWMQVLDSVNYCPICGEKA